MFKLHINILTCIMREVYRCILLIDNKLLDVMIRKDKKHSNTLRELKIYAWIKKKPNEEKQKVNTQNIVGYCFSGKLMFCCFTTKSKHGHSFFILNSTYGLATTALVYSSPCQETTTDSVAYGGINLNLISSYWN